MSSTHRHGHAVHHAGFVPVAASGPETTPVTYVEFCTVVRFLFLPHPLRTYCSRRTGSATLDWGQYAPTPPGHSSPVCSVRIAVRLSPFETTYKVRYYATSLRYHFVAHTELAIGRSARDSKGMMSSNGQRNESHTSLTWRARKAIISFIAIRIQRRRLGSIATSLTASSDEYW